MALVASWRATPMAVAALVYLYWLIRSWKGLNFSLICARCIPLALGSCSWGAGESLGASDSSLVRGSPAPRGLELPESSIARTIRMDG